MRTCSSFVKPSKYRSKKTEVEGIVFDSKKEADRYIALLLQLKAGIIKNLVIQPKFELQPKFKNPYTGERIRAITYYPDFQYITREGILKVEDVKGMQTNVFKLKRKLFIFKFPEIELILL